VLQQIVNELNLVQSKVVNDISERAVKLIQDFATSITNDETQKQYLLQVVEQQRKAVPNFNKDTVNNL